MESVIMAANLATVQDSEITRVMGSFPEMQQVERALRANFAL